MYFFFFLDDDKVSSKELTHSRILASHQPHFRGSKKKEHGFMLSFNTKRLMSLAMPVKTTSCLETIVSKCHGLFCLDRISVVS